MERAAIDWKLKDDIEPIPLTDSFYYLLMYGGYIKPEYLLTDEDQVKQVRDAMAVLSSFEKVLEDNELLEEV